MATVGPRLRLVAAGEEVEPSSVQAAPAPIDPATAEYRRVFAFLASMRAVMADQACLAEPGFAYLGLPFRFPGGGLS